MTKEEQVKRIMQRFGCTKQTALGFLNAYTFEEIMKSPGFNVVNPFGKQLVTHYSSRPYC